MRAARWALILFQFFFLNVYLPGHVRGAVRLDGKSSGASCCCSEEGASRVSAKSRGRHVPTSEDRQCCAVCYLAAHYTPVEPFVFDASPQEWVREAHEALAAQVRSVDFHIPFWAAGPPVEA
jgi:hypothetical protein